MNSRRKANGRARCWAAALHGMVVLVLAARVATGNEAEAEPGVFMKIDGVGAWLPVRSVAVASDPSSARPIGTMVHVSKRPDAATPGWLEALGDGRVLKPVSLIWRRTDGVFCRMALESVVVEALDVRRSPSSEPGIVEEVWTLRCGAIRWSWYGLEGDGQIHGGLAVRWDASGQSAEAREFPRFQARIEGVIEPRGAVKLTWPAERGRTYRILSTPSLTENWETVEEITALEDGEQTRQWDNARGRLFLMVQAVD